MATKGINNLFDFKRTLPKPFDTLSSKIVATSSTYGNKTQSTLTGNVIKMLNAVCGCMKNEPGAVGLIDKNKSVAEYKSSISDEYHLVVYNSETGDIFASVYNKSTEAMTPYMMNPSARDGSAVLMAMFPFLMEDDEFKEKFNSYKTEYMTGFSDIGKATDLAAILCDNVYRRVKDDALTAHIETVIDTAGNLTRISQVNLDKGTYAPQDVIAGAFTIFDKTKTNCAIQRAIPIMNVKDLAGKFKFTDRQYNAVELCKIPVMPEWYVVPKEVIDICKHAMLTTGKSYQMRNFMLRGPAGSGKTMDAKAIASALNLPYMLFTCSSGTEIFDLLGQMLPKTEAVKSGDENLDSEIDMLNQFGGITYENVAKVMSLPDIDDMDYDPVGVYERLTGTQKENATSQECMTIVLERVTAKIKSITEAINGNKPDEQKFIYTETDFIKAIKNGYLIEIQEPTVITQPGVLVGLNSLLEQGGKITLPTGETITRHPDTVIIVTTNIDYDGCRNINQSVNDRMNMIFDVETPSAEVMMDRAMNITGEKDENMVSKMVDVVIDMAEYCRQNNVTDGEIGMRSLIDWIVSAQISGNVYDAALHTVISKATADTADRESLIVQCLEPKFEPTYCKAKTA